MRKSNAEVHASREIGSRAVDGTSLPMIAQEGMTADEREEWDV